MSDPDSTLRAVEIAATIGSVSRLKDGSASIRIRSALEFSKAAFWPLSLLQDEAATVLIQPDNIGADADAIKPKGKRGGSASQQQRFMLEAIGAANGVPAEKLEDYYQKLLQSNIQRLQKELERAQNRKF